MHAHDISQSHAQILPHDLIHANLPLLARIIRQHDAHRILSLFALEQHRVPSEQLQLLHLLKIQRHDRVIIVDRLIYDARTASVVVHRASSREIRVVTSSRRREASTARSRIRTDDETIRRLFTLQNGGGKVRGFGFLLYRRFVRHVERGARSRTATCGDLRARGNCPEGRRLQKADADANGGRERERERERTWTRNG